jgi:hypothetical protein
MVYGRAKSQLLITRLTLVDTVQKAQHCANMAMASDV